MDPLDDPALPLHLSSGRHGKFLAYTADDPSRAIRLYVWNTAAAAALWGGFHVLEVALRNALHQQLTQLAGREDWWAGDLPFHHDQRRQLRSAQERIRTTKGADATAGHVVAELNFSFWTSLLANRYHERLWQPALHNAFPHRSGRRGALHRDLEILRKLRNRIAHHEPVLARDLAADHRSILTVLHSISPSLHTWVDRCSRVPAVLAERPGVVDGTIPATF
jgi:hypothetical protein